MTTLTPTPACAPSHPLARRRRDDGVAQLRRLHRRARPRCSRPTSRRFGLTMGDYEVLVRLSEADDHRMRMCDLAGQLRLSPSGLTRRLDGLVQERRRSHAQPSARRPPGDAAPSSPTTGYELLERRRAAPRRQRSPPLHRPAHGAEVTRVGSAFGKVRAALPRATLHDRDSTAADRSRPVAASPRASRATSPTSASRTTPTTSSWSPPIGPCSRRRRVHPQQLRRTQRGGQPRSTSPTARRGRWS